ncbi:C2 domain-containing protein 3-like [Littorina saxatilis]|uniref:C2 domain-containing protein n=1 Tax=Littorina saxatilis TaxID=31220 RepID=A0AAN9B4H3_9CAEN
MVKKKLNPAKGVKKGDEAPAPSDVKVNTGLPPKVDGQIRCFCKVCINQVLWSKASPPTTIVLVKWWGEDGKGTVFRPLDVKKGNKSSARTTGQYPVRSGPRQFAAYLQDMGSLSLAVFTSETAAEPVGHAHVTQIGLLSNNRPINGFFPILSPQDQKIGELQVSLMLEPVDAPADDMSSVPTTDLNMGPHHKHESMLPSATRPLPHSQQPSKPQEDLFISPASNQADVAGLSNSARTYNAADLRQRLNYGLGDTGRNNNYSSVMFNGAATTPLPSSPQRPTAGAGETQRHRDKDLLSVLLSRGTDLRQAMVKSSLNSQDQQHNNNANMAPQSPARPVGGAAGGVPATYSPAPGVMVDNLLGDYGHSPVDMLLGSPVAKHEWQMLQMLNGASPGPSICSDMMEGIDKLSDPGDPLHDRTLLQELFYKRSESELSGLSGLSGDEGASMQGSVQDAGNVRPPSRCSSISSMAAALPSPRGTPTKKRKRKLKSRASASDPSKTVRRSRSRSSERSRSRSKERNPRMTKTITAPQKPKSRSRSRSGSRKKSRSRSRSLSQKRKSSLSDSDSGTPRSEISRVSFDPAPSDVEDDMDQNPQEKQVDGLSVERLTLLGRVHVARVNILALHLQGYDLDTSSNSKSSKRTGKPPRPVKNRKPCTYLIEYQFPVVATSRDKYSPNAMATEVMRVVGKAVNNGVVSFNHRSVFPLMFDGTALEKWWKSALIFKVFSREAGQKAPVLLGSCGVPLKSILKSDDLHLSRDLEIRELGRNGSFNSTSRNASLNSSRSASGAPLLGVLKVSVELASDHKDFATSLARTRVAEMSGGGQNIVPVVPPSLPPVPSLSLPPPASPSRQHGKSHQSAKHVSPEKLSGYSSKQQSHPMKSVPSSAPSFPSSLSMEHAQLHKPVFHTTASPPQSSQQEAQTLHMLILVPEGCNVSLHGVPPLHMVSRNPALVQQQLAHHAQAGRDQMTRNTYLVCRMFWSNDSVHSNVCWGTLNPQYNFSQVAPVLVTSSLLERMRNNYMVIEVWDKKTSAENDKLIGISKLSLHQFFMSFRDPKIAGALLRSEYPVVAIDNYMPVVDPFSGLHYGQLSVMLAMGSAEQVACLQRLKGSKDMTGAGPQRPNHFLERQDMYGQDQGNVRLDSSGTSVEHGFEIVIQGVRGLKLLESMIWGEADCFVQYYFPTQSQAQQQGPTVVLASPALRSFRTATTLCIPDPTFHDVTRHKVTLPVGTPVQRELLTACANSSGGSGGLPFEVWTRFYHPNVRDQVIARTTLPLAKLCAMVTMQKRGEPSVQSFSLPLTPVASDSRDAEGQAKMKDSGLMDVTVHYKAQRIENAVNTSISQPSSGSQVCLSVAVTRASGLKAAAEAAARGDSGMQYPAEVGVNAYVRLRLSFLGKQEERVTKTVARTFSPEFSHHLEFPLQLLWSGSHDDPGSLAQMLETGQAEFEIWHQVPGMISGVTEYECDDRTGGKRLVPTSGDVLLGTCTVPLTQLLARHGGIKGWFAVDRPTSTWAQSDSSASEEGPASRMVGGLELSLHFSHSSDRQRVIEAARSVGWCPIDPTVEQDDWQEEETGQQQQHQVMVNVDKVSVPVSRVLLSGQTSLDPSARCYIRYKFYDRAAVVSRTARLQGEGDRLHAGVHHRHTMVLPHSAPFHWYLREEHLELQVWVTYGSKEKGQRPQQRDKLIGTAYVDLLPLADSRRRQHRISGLLPLFKPGAANLAGAFLQLHLTSNLCHGNQLLDDEDDVVENGELSDVDYDSSDSFHQVAAGGSRSPVKQGWGERAVNRDAMFTVHLAVERALHLPTVRVPGRSCEAAPTTYISYQTANRATPTYSDIVPDCVDPVWDYSAEVHLTNDLLTQENKNLVLKVWHKPQGASKQPDKSSDRVLGFVSVDLCPLNSGLRQICGWYNIVDVNGQSRGQIKVSITPVDLDHRGNSNAATGGPSVSILSSRGGSMYLPSEPVAGLNFFPTSLPSFNGSNAAATGSGPSSMPVMSVSSHWQPRFSVPGAVSSAEDSSKSMLFTSLRQQLRDLDGMTQRLRLRLSCDDSDIDANQPASARSADILTGTQSGLSTIHTSSSLTMSRDVLSDVSRQLLASREMAVADTSQRQSEDNTSHNAADSGAFSGDNTGKSQEPPDSQRSEQQVTLGVAVSRAQSGVAGRVLSSLPPTGLTPAETLTATAEARYLTESPQGALTPRSPRDFSSNSQTSQGFQPMSGPVPSDSSTSGSARVRGQKVPSLTNLTVEEDEDSPRPALLQPDVGDDRPETAVMQDYKQNHADYHSDDNSDDDEMFGSYHHYRAMLDREEQEHRHDDEEVEDDSNLETVTPRRINDVSGMLRQFAQHPGTLPPVFLPQGLSSGDATFAQTWPNAQHPNLDSERSGYSQDQPIRQEEREEKDGEEGIETERFLPQEAERDEAVQDRNSFIDSWLEDSAERERNSTVRSEPRLLTPSEQHSDRQDTTTTHHQQFELDLPSSGEEESEEGTPRAEDTPRSAPVEGRSAAGGMHLLSNVEFIETITSVPSAVRTRNGQRRGEAEHDEERRRDDAPSAFQQVNGYGDERLGRHDPHLLSNVELYSTVSSMQITTRPPAPRHLLSNVELASTASGSSHHPDTASSRASRQSSANSAGRRPELEACAEEENTEDKAEFNATKPLSARSEEVSEFFSTNRQAAVVNGGYDSSDEELDYQYTGGARAATAKSRVAVKAREPCQSMTATTEDSGLESGAKSSQDEREALSLLDSTQGHGQGHSQGAVPEFFLPTEELQASMRALKLATSAATTHAREQTRSAAKAKASAELSHKLNKTGTTSNKFNGTVSAKGRQLPTAEEAKRIAKIFSTKPS